MRRPVVGRIVLGRRPGDGIEDLQHGSPEPGRCLTVQPPRSRKPLDLAKDFRQRPNRRPVSAAVEVPQGFLELLDEGGL